MHQAQHVPMRDLDAGKAQLRPDQAVAFAMNHVGCELPLDRRDQIGIHKWRRRGVISVDRRMQNGSVSGNASESVATTVPERQSSAHPFGILWGKWHSAPASRSWLRAVLALKSSGSSYEQN